MHSLEAAWGSATRSSTVDDCHTFAPPDTPGVQYRSMINLDEARQRAWAPVEVSDDWEALRRLVLALCDEVERLRLS